MAYITDGVTGGNDELCEPAVVYDSRPRAVAGPWTVAAAGSVTGFSGDAGGGFDIDRMMGNYLFRAEIGRRLEEARVAREEGRVTPHKEAMRKFWGKVDNGLL